MTAATDDKISLLSPALAARLDHLDVLSRKILAGKLRGERRSKRRGQSVEFADFRNYTPGDDPRFIDWNIYARLDRLLLKLFMAEEDLSLYILCDISRSCDYGQPNKGHYIKQAAAALAYIGLVQNNRVTVVAVGDKVKDTGPMRGRTRLPRMIDFLQNLEPEKGADFVESCKRFSLQHRQKGVCVMLSDFLIKDGFDHGLKYLAGPRYDFFAVQILSPQELHPELRGELRLVDVEDDDLTEVSITQPLLKKYQATLASYCDNLKNYVTRRGGSYLRISTDIGIDTLILTLMRKRGLVG